MNPGVQLITELNTTHMSYVDLATLALALLKQQLALQKSTAEQRLVWEMLRVLNKAQHKERDQDVARSLREMRDKALANFSKRPESGLTIYEDTAREVANQVAVRATQKAFRAGGVTERGDANNLNTGPSHQGRRRRKVFRQPMLQEDVQRQVWRSGMPTLARQRHHGGVQGQVGRKLR